MLILLYCNFINFRLHHHSFEFNICVPYSIKSVIFSDSFQPYPVIISRTLFWGLCSKNFVSKYFRIVDPHIIELTYFISHFTLPNFSPLKKVKHERCSVRFQAICFSMQFYSWLSEKRIIPIEWFFVFSNLLGKFKRFMRQVFQKKYWKSSVIEFKIKKNKILITSRKNSNIR